MRSTRGARCRRFAVAALSLVGATVLPLPPADAAGARCDLRVDGDRLTATVRQTSPRAAMEALARSVPLRHHWLTEAGADPIDVDLRDVPVAEGVHRLLEGLNHFALVEANGEISVWITGSAMASASGPSPGLALSGQGYAQASGLGVSAPSYATSPAAGPAFSRAGGGAGASLGGSGSGSFAGGGGGSSPSASSGALAAPAAPVRAAATPPASLEAVPVRGEVLRLVDVQGSPDLRELEVVLQLADGDVLPERESTGDPTEKEAALRIFNPKTGELARLPLPASGWVADEESNAYAYADPEGAKGPCTDVTVGLDGVVVARCRGRKIPYSLDEERQEELVVELILGRAPDGIRLCARFGGVVRHDETTAGGGAATFEAEAAPAPTRCVPRPTPAS